MTGRSARRSLAGITVLALAGLAPRPAVAQDTTRAGQPIRFGITYTPGQRPGMLVLGGPHRDILDSVRAMLRRDLDYSDRFEIINLPGGDSLMVGVGPAAATGTAKPPTGGAQSSDQPFVNYALYQALGADYAVGATPADSGVDVTVYDVHGQAVRRRVHLANTDVASPGFRLAVHHVSDEVVRGVSGTAGVAATRLLFVQQHRVYEVDVDGQGLRLIPGIGQNALSPSWAPDGHRIAYMEIPPDAKPTENAGRIYVMDLDSGQRTLVAPTSRGLNFVPVFSPDGSTMAFARAAGEGTDVYTYNLASQCCLERLTVGGFSDNLSPTYSPDGRRIAFVSDRAGAAQVYVMAADGTGQELLAPFDYGVTGASNAPEWSPDGVNVAFHRVVAGSPQVFVMDVATRTPRQLTSEGRNEDPTWAPDSRHLAFVSDRTGSRQIWIVDIDTGRVRQLTRLGEARLPAWSPRIP